jgi:hypothetical protein
VFEGIACCRLGRRAKLRDCTLAAFELGDEFPTRDRSNHPEHHRTEDP